jgi:hypothetical protein
MVFGGGPIQRWMLCTQKNWRFRCNTCAIAAANRLACPAPLTVAQSSFAKNGVHTDLPKGAGMRDETPVMVQEGARASDARATATIIPFPIRGGRPVLAAKSASGGVPVFDAVLDGLDARSRIHPPTLLAASGALAGFAAQQSLLLSGGSAWAQPVRAERLDRLLLNTDSPEASLWRTLEIAANEIGVQHLPDPQKLLASTLKCMGTSQFGQITLPLEYRLQEQPQTALVSLWARVRTVLDDAGVAPSAWPRVMALMCAERVVVERKHVPPHVALRIVMQAALAMALVEPRVIPGAALKPE